ncbi:uncharacterized protein M421DRAFT_398885 [Didymella exigua CBS 183.55]|uniref:Uncharacterized protein n=1 Tax=Didymella exigua CBS 183.55 TaxID=1150837 RepID=A0A6A5S1Z6_9PLEO|nr:uncharacterized protein M421DRAFT_398885 [Didymella exigua CBS 183.55]KAF1932526.1 hypothetical protein M421DRAFT_398885 [Didymella exigua CBS 183.55]
MGGVRRHTESNNFVLLTQILEGKRLVALMAINNQQPVATHCLGCCMLDEVLQPL